ncbi:MAG TPA: hypothetical protein VNH11_30180 [Pirellulales bacterium]|nr:hypothetical protein [Pirellulales bacterium]
MRDESIPRAPTQLAATWRATGTIEFEDIVFWVAPLPPSAWNTFQQQTGGERVESGQNVVRSNDSCGSTRPGKKDAAARWRDKLPAAKPEKKS